MAKTTALFTFILLIASCASSRAPENGAAARVTTTAAPTTVTTTTVDMATTTTTAAEPEEAPMPTEQEPSELRCSLVTNFESADANEQWLVVNDNVMGGRSLGDRSFAGSTMVFAGAINTNGGGFSSLRLPLREDAIADADRVVFRARADARTYMVTFDDALPGRNRRVSFRAPIEFQTPGEWETVEVSFADLIAAVFGQPVVDEPFRKDLATRMGIMLSDGLDGEFTLEVDSIEVCTDA